MVAALVAAAGGEAVPAEAAAVVVTGAADGEEAAGEIEAGAAVAAPGCTALALAATCADVSTADWSGIDTHVPFGIICFLDGVGSTKNTPPSVAQ